MESTWSRFFSKKQVKQRRVKREEKNQGNVIIHDNEAPTKSKVLYVYKWNRRRVKCCSFYRPISAKRLSNISSRVTEVRQSIFIVWHSASHQRSSRRSEKISSNAGTTHSIGRCHRTLPSLPMSHHFLIHRLIGFVPRCATFFQSSVCCSFANWKDWQFSCLAPCYYSRRVPFCHAESAFDQTDELCWQLMIVTTWAVFCFCSLPSAVSPQQKLIEFRCHQIKLSDLKGSMINLMSFLY